MVSLFLSMWEQCNGTLQCQWVSLTCAVVVWTLIVRSSGTERSSNATGRWGGRCFRGEQAEEEEVLRGGSTKWQQCEEAQGVCGALRQTYAA